MLLLLHALIPCVAVYILSFRLRMLHALILCVAAYILPFFSNFWHCHPYILQHFNVFILIFRCILACKYNPLCVLVQAPPLLLLVVI